MLLILPVGTDAPVYHWPYGTVLLILLNTVIFFALDQTTLVMWYGQGLHPEQWLTSNFAHGDFFHLLFNMIFLWGFGIIVEGKLGLLRYVFVYVLTGVIQCFILQLLLLGVMLLLGVKGPSGSLGASSCIAGLMAMSLLWAPKNDLSIFLLIGWRAILFDVSILSFCIFFMGLDAISWVLQGFQMSTAMLHTTGAIVGGTIGYVMLMKNMVDCEGWDLFSVMDNKHLKLAYELDDVSATVAELEERKARKQAREKRKADKELEVKIRIGQFEEHQKQTVRKSIHKLLQKKDYDKALSHYTKAQTKWNDFSVEDDDLKQLGNVLYKKGQFLDCAPYYEEYLLQSFSPSVSVKIRLAAVYIEHMKKPQDGLHLLEEIDGDQIAQSLQEVYTALKRQAQQQLQTQ